MVFGLISKYGRKKLLLVEINNFFFYNFVHLKPDDPVHILQIKKYLFPILLHVLDQNGDFPDDFVLEVLCDQFVLTRHVVHFLHHSLERLAWTVPETESIILKYCSLQITFITIDKRN